MVLFHRLSFSAVQISDLLATHPPKRANDIPILASVVKRWHFLCRQYFIHGANFDILFECCDGDLLDIPD